MPVRKSTITVASDAELQNPVYWRRLKLAVQNCGLSQREWPDKIADMFRDADGRGTRFQFAPVRYEIPMVDETWDDNERYVRDFLAAANCEYPERDRLFDTYFRVEKPHIARHFGR